MQSIPPTSQPWFGLSPTRCHQIINAQLKGTPVDLTWYELLCEFLNECFSCCHNTPLTHAAVDRAVRGLVSAQIRISAVIKEGPGKYSLDSVCSNEIRIACEHARKLASFVENNSESSGLKIMVKPEQSESEVAVKSSKELGMAITNANGEPLIMLSRCIPEGFSSPRYDMLTIPDPKNNLSQKLYIWRPDGQGNQCKSLQEAAIRGSKDLDDFY